MTETISTTTRERLAEAGLTEEQISLALKTSTDLRALVQDLPEDTGGLRLRDIYESEKSS
ncbi:hypothetical protein AB8880_12910 [Alphaproteobacteria bacterium LSUCC0684]